MSSATSNKNLKRKITIVSGDENLNILMLDNVIKNIQLKITKNTKELNKILGVPLPNIEFSKDSISNSKEGNYRIIVVPNLNSIPQKFKFNKQSHIIVALYNPNITSSIWKEDEQCRVDAIVEFPSALELSYIIQDVALDIQLSHYHQLASNNIPDDKELSKAKVNFINNQSSLNYISLATDCRDKTGYKFNDFLEKWENFNNFYTPSGKRRIDAKNVSAVEKILQSHPQYGQISIKKIQELIHDLEPGDYILIRTTKKPRTKKMRIKVLTQFGIKNWKTGKIKIESIDKFYNYYRYNRYLSVFKFSVK